MRTSTCVNSRCCGPALYVLVLQPTGMSNRGLGDRVSLADAVAEPGARPG
jgi:hypothetical protein